MRVLIATDWCANPGGTEGTVRTIRDALRAGGDEVRLLTSSAGSADDGRAEHVAYGTERRVQQVALQVVNPFAVRAVRAALHDFQPDAALVLMFELHLSPAVILALRAVPTVAYVVYSKPVCPTGLRLLPDDSVCTVPSGRVCVRTGCVSLPHWLRDRPRYALIRRALEGADRVLTCSEAMRATLAQGGIAADLLALPSPPPRHPVGEPAPTPLFVFVGRLSREKGVALLLRAFRGLVDHHPASRLRIVGDGPERARLERSVDALGLRDSVLFRGRVAGNDVGAELAGAWALVAPSLWPEPLGLVAVEAICAGIPVVASAVGGFAETIEPDVTGVLFPNGDVGALRRRLLEVVNWAPARRRVAPAATLRLQERHDAARHVAALRTIFRDATRACVA